MIRSVSRLITGSVIFAIVTTAIAFSAFAQSDPDPNSPSPVLLGLQVPLRRPPTTGTSVQRVAPVSHIRLLISNLALMGDEGPGAFRVYGVDPRGHQYRFPASALQLYDPSRGIYLLDIDLRDELGYYESPTFWGDLLLSVSWRGNISNDVQLSTGKPVPPTTTPTPTIPKRTPPSGPGLGGSQDSIAGLIGYKYSGDRMRFLEQATFGPTDMEDNRIRRIGLRVWLGEQFTLPYPSAENPWPDIPLKPSSAPPDCDGDQTVTPDLPVTCSRDTYTMYPIQTWFYREALYGDAQLRHRVTWALSQIWVTSGLKLQQSSYMVTFYQQLAKNAFGNWRQLMSDVTLNPGMGNYLDMITSTKGNPNENYPREFLQLFNVGLFMLNQDGTVQCVEHNPCQTGDTPIPTYDQTTINNFTKVLTGWRDCRAASATCPNYVSSSVPDYKDPMDLNPSNHDLTAKTLFNYPGAPFPVIAACASPCTSSTDRANYANTSLNQALDNIYNHPNVAPFVSKHLIQAMVTSDPTPAYVGRVSAVFNANRTSPDQMREVIKAILLDPEARGDVKTDPHFGKLREPVQLATNLMRLFNATGATGFAASDGQLNPDVSGLGQNAFNAPSVFNYYPPDYIIPGTSLTGPEFSLFNTGTSIARANFANTFVMGSGRTSAPPDRPNGTVISLADVIPYSSLDSTGNRMLDYLNTKMMHGTMSTQMRNLLLPAVTAVAATDPTTRAKVAVYLIYTSSQYQVQR